MQRINLKRIANPCDEDYFSEICCLIGDNNKHGGFIQANLRCRMSFVCKINTGKADDYGNTIFDYQNISILIPSASEMIDLIIREKTNQFNGNNVVSVEFWKALVYYSQIFLGIMRNSPLQFSLSNADAASRNFDNFEEFLGGMIRNPEKAMWYLTLGDRGETDLFNYGRSFHLTLTQEIHNTSNNSNWWSGDINWGSNVVGFLPLPAFVNQGVKEWEAKYDRQLDRNGMMLFFEESGTLENDTTFITGFLTSYLPHRAVKWQKEDSMTPDIINANLEKNGIDEHTLLDQSTINGMFNKITNFLHGLYTKTASHTSVLTSLLVKIKFLADENRRRRQEIMALQDFNPIGCIVQFVGTMKETQLDYYRLCDGRPIGYSANDKRFGDFEQINKMMWELAKNQNPKDATLNNFDYGRIYDVPDLRGFFLVGARPALDASATIDNIVNTKKNIEINEMNGDYTYLLSDRALPFHKHNYELNRGNYVVSGSNGSGSSRPRQWTSSMRNGDDTGERSNNNTQERYCSTPPYFAINYYIRVLQ